MQGASQLLLNTLQLFSKDAALSAAVLQLLLLIGKAPKGAVSLSELQLLPAVANLLSEHEGNVSICGFALKLLKRVAKQPACREALARAGAQQLLLDCAHCMAALEGQQQQVKVSQPDVDKFLHFLAVQLLATWYTIADMVLHARAIVPA